MIETILDFIYGGFRDIVIPLMSARIGGVVTVGTAIVVLKMQKWTPFSTALWVEQLKAGQELFGRAEAVVASALRVWNLAHAPRGEEEFEKQVLEAHNADLELTSAKGGVFLLLDEKTQAALKAFEEAHSDFIDGMVEGASLPDARPLVGAWLQPTLPIVPSAPHGRLSERPSPWQSSPLSTSVCRFG